MTSPRSRRRVFWCCLAALPSVATVVWCLLPGGGVVRSIAINGAESRRTLPGCNIDVFHSIEELRVACPGSRPDPEVDFRQENVVRVGWESNGIVTGTRPTGTDQAGKPIFGKLAWRARMGGRDITFFVTDPVPYGQVQCVFQRITAEGWFVVPKSVRVRFVRASQAVGRDAAFLSLVLLGAILLPLVACLRGSHR